MVRKIIKIEEAACNGCGICAAACHEGAIEMREGKARLVREDFCDGLGDCRLGVPPARSPLKYERHRSTMRRRWLRPRLPLSLRRCLAAVPAASPAP